MALELRCRFLDQRLLEVVRRARLEWLVDGKRGKRPLRKPFASALPEPVFTRARRGFSVPIDRWMNQMPLEELLLTPGDPMQAILDATRIRRKVRSRWLRHWKVTVSAQHA